MPEKFVVIMAGGRGERFWPQSRLRRPKHLLPIVGDKPMLTQTVERLEGLAPAKNILIITNAEQRDAVVEVCPMLPPENVIAEPVGRDTAPAVGLAMELVRARDPEGVFAMLPADHVIHDAEGFRRVLSAAFEAAAKEPVLVTIGVEPEFPATGFGYVHKGEQYSEIDGLPVFRVQRFVEKPDLETAKSYVESGEYYWNAGMFVWTVPTVDAAFAAHSPTLHTALGKIKDALAAKESIVEILAREYPTLDKISIDFALMEKADNVVTMPSAFDWDDVGEWPAVSRHHKQDAAGNVIKGAGWVEQGSGNIVFSENDGHLLALVGVDDMIVVRTADATLVCPKSKAQEIKKLVKELGAHETWKKLM
ncbi:mannose-1-phosphate guanylyltransferase [Cerasicoccus arenae]|uniref:mannose-1-phosphate guanylyltransferase n=1 Tax=Cerasicoccus arenae TaxID=424488 RepID=A0A8J3GDW1_9BACT|nr:sugar phosphate nucleotidyltransferase [Cerasicoccus arenae]MBK1859484.1 mannose-1-phosphate guanylyltransferase [Cerasicoccus arenae]GHB94899.1 mannose-1-phosphate guanylyltransferase [Cerasicoccus arenae]